MFIDGKFVDSKTTEWIDLHDPATNKVVTRVPKCTQDEMESAVESSKKAFKVRIAACSPMSEQFYNFAFPVLRLGARLRSWAVSRSCSNCST